MNEHRRFRFMYRLRCWRGVDPVRLGGTVPSSDRAGSGEMRGGATDFKEGEASWDASWIVTRIPSARWIRKSTKSSTSRRCSGERRSSLLSSDSMSEQILFYPVFFVICIKRLRRHVTYVVVHVHRCWYPRFSKGFPPPTTTFSGITLPIIVQGTSRYGELFRGQSKDKLVIPSAI